MANVNFYHLTVSPMGKALPKLLEKVIGNNMRALVVASNDEEVEKLNKELWTYTTKFFLPHGSIKDGYTEQQPIFISASNDNINNSNVLVIVGNAVFENVEKFEKSLYMFDGDSEEQLSTARKRWKELKSQGHELIYWQQNKKGGWEKGAN